ncbi:MAG: TIGR01777 family oxidoreductase [Myxococcota bacterium]
MRVMVSGSSGLVGQRVCEALETRGDEVVRLVRDRAQAENADAALFLPMEGVAELDGADAVIHLAGESIAGGPWTADRMARIKGSRVDGTKTLAEAIARLERKPSFVSASAIGYYGDRGASWMDESSPAGELFLSEVCVAWEDAADAARDVGARVVHPRIGIVLAKEGGALGTMLTPFKMGLGGVVGSGEQYMSWISLSDVVGALVHLAHHPDATGPVNLVGPDPVTNRVFTKALGKAIKRPTFLPLPSFAAKTVFGQLGDELLLASTRVKCERLQTSGYAFAQPSLEEALQDALQ